jgi:hypothetical protein
MLKIVTLMAYLNLADKDPTILAKRLDYQYEADAGQYYKPQETLASGYHTVRELLIQMITESDNTAMRVLNQEIPDKVISVYHDLKLADPLSPNIDFMSPESYSHLFRTLYGSTYLSRPYSEEALKLLSHTNFDIGLVAGTGSTTIAHKFGEQTLRNQSGEVVERELHDCGIIYYPERPYFLCVMTKGNEFTGLDKVIKNISKLVYDVVTVP